MKQKENIVKTSLQMLDTLLTTDHFISYNSNLVGEMLYTIRHDMELTKADVVKQLPTITIADLSRYENGFIPYSEVNKVKKIIHVYHILNL